MTYFLKNTTLAAFLSLALAGLIAMVGTAHGQTAMDDLDVQARRAIESFFGAVMGGDPDRLKIVLAPEFQIQRANGSRYDAAGYIDSVLPVIAEMPGINELVVTSTENIFVTTYIIDVNETLEGAVVESKAPRLTVFRKIGDDWRVVAHGNFSAIRQ